MYNADLKQKFIDQLPLSETTKNSYYFVFNKTEKIESEAGMDLCQITDRDILVKILDCACGYKNSTEASTKGRFRRYINWCISEGIPGATDAMLKLKDVSISNDKFSKKTVSSPEELKIYLNSLFDKEKKKTYDNVIRAYFWLAFIGVGIEDVLDIRNEEVDIKHRKITHNGNVYEICDEAIESIKNCVELKEFVYSHPNYEKDILRSRVQSDQLLRGVKSEAKAVTIRAFITKLIRKGNPEKMLTYEGVHLSGVCYRLYEREKDGFPIDFMQVAGKYLSKSKRYVSVRERARHLKREYELWKKTYIKM